MAERGSSKLVRERALPKGELDRLWKVIDEDREIRLIHWWERGQPGPDVLFGTVKTDIGNVGGVIAKLYDFNELRLRLDAFPYGIPVPDEILIHFEPAGPVR
jgi:hypothetical protein